MAIIIGDNLSLNTAKPNLDSRWGPYNSVQQAFDALDDRDVLCVGLTVGVRNPETGLVDEYWFRNRADSIADLIKKNDDDDIKNIMGRMEQTLNNIDERMDKQEEAQESDEWLEL